MGFASLRRTVGCGRTIILAVPALRRDPNLHCGDVRVKAHGEKQSRNGPPSAPRDPLVTELAKAESDLERIEAQRTAAKDRIAALRNELATLDPAPRPVAPEPLSGLAPRTPADKVKLFRQLFRGRPDLYP